MSFAAAPPDPREGEQNPFMAPTYEEGVAPVGSLGRIGEGSAPPRRSAIVNACCIWRSSSRPITSLVFILFRFGAITLYLLGNFLLGMEFITVFVSTLLCLALDFWVTKNVAGRLLVALRWWVTVKEDGSNEWTYESAPPGRKIHPVDSRLFWFSLYTAPVAWAAFAFTSLITLSFEWLLIDVVALALTITNLMGYLRCSSEAQKKLQSTITSGAMRGLSLVPGGLGGGIMTALGAGTASVLSRVIAGAGGATNSTPVPPTTATGPVTGAVAPVLPAPVTTGTGGGFSGDVTGVIPPLPGSVSSPSGEGFGEDDVRI